ncbi:MAG: PDZ domain-containing protein [Desulfobacterales bacterium]|nr:PDZ domain-containing protein [Desulfobacterales bacterium]
MKAPGVAATVVILGLLAGICLAAEGGNNDFLLWEVNRLRLAGEQLPLGKVLKELGRRTGIKTRGLENRHRETVNLEIEAKTIEGLFGRLLKQLKVQNFAMEYRGGRLARISVLPASTDVAGGRDPAPSVDAEAANPTTDVVRVQRVIADTQAERVGLKEGDFVIAYNGRLVQNHEQLIELTRQTDPRNPVEMVVARNDDTLRLTVQGGTIGIGIRTIQIFTEEYETYADAIP